MSETQKLEFVLFVSIIVTIVIITYSVEDKKSKENFTNQQTSGEVSFLDAALNSYETTNQITKDIFPTVTADDVTIEKNIISSGDITSNGDIKITGGTTLTKTGHIYTKDIHPSGSIQNINGSGINIDKQFIQKLKSITAIGGYAIDGGGSTHLLFEGGWYNLFSTPIKLPIVTISSNELFDAWSNDAWDTIYILRGWKIELSEHGTGTGSIWWSENKTKNSVIKFTPPANKVSSYRLSWVGY